MSDLQKDAEYWHRTTLELIELIYQVKDKALGDPFGEHARWHEILSRVTAELRLLSAWLARIPAHGPGLINTNR